MRLQGRIELARITLADPDLSTAMEKITQRTVTTLPGAHAASVTLVEEGKPSSIAFTGQLALGMDERQYERGYGPCLDALTAAGQVIHVLSMRTDDRWPA